MRTEADYERLGAAIRTRRVELGFNQEEVKQLGGPSSATLRKIEGGQALQYRITTTRPLERVLRWHAGSIEAVLDGGSPTPEDIASAVRVDQAANNGALYRPLDEASDAELLSELLQRALRRDGGRASVAAATDAATPPTPVHEIHPREIPVFDIEQHAAMHGEPSPDDPDQ